MSSQQELANNNFHLSTIGRTGTFVLLLVAVLLAGTLCSAADRAKRPGALQCTNGASLPTGGDGTQDVQVVGPGTCFVNAGTYGYNNINIYNGGSLQFVDNGNTDLWAANILVENNSSLIAGSPNTPYGVNGTLTIHLWGAAQPVGTGKGDGGVGITCLSDSLNQCGVPTALWTSNPSMGFNPTSCVLAKDVVGFGQNLPGNVNDCFYAYMSLDYDDGGTPPGYFGYKVLGVSYGGTLQLFGKKGATYTKLTAANSGTSWARLTQDLNGTGAETSLVLDRAVDWVANDQIVLTTTDYLPGHSEQFTIQSVSTSGGVSTITVTSPVQYPHNGTTYNLGAAGVPSDIGPDQDPNVICTSGQTRCVETRAAVGLLTRSIRIVSEGDTWNTPFPASSTGYSFGGHTLVRQGAAVFQVQGVEFYQMGEGGRIMHYPVHFHMARLMPQPSAPGNPPVTFVADSSVHDSMTRWYTIHATQGVTLARNVGFLSIGHGYYLEDGSETGNQLYSNLGVFARGGVQNPQNPRNVPGILAAAHHNSADDEVPFHTDTDHPTVFWIMNGWNDFQYNMAAGAGTCGMCYWFVPATNSGDARYEYWNSYAGEQQYRQSAGGVDDYTQSGITPLYKFAGNSCSSAQNSFITIGDTSECDLGPAPQIPPIINPLAPDFPQDISTEPFSPQADAYYPKVPSGGARAATQCPASGSCALVNQCAYTTGQNTAPPNCMITDIDHYTSSFNWAETNVGAIWLRKQWYLLTNSALTDVQNGGLTFVSGGGYSGSDEVPGYWALAHKDVFIGMSKPSNNFASNAGPFNPNSKLNCDPGLPASFCSSLNEGVAMPLGGFAVNQRFFSIYDGPSYQSANAYLDITTTTLTGCTKGGGGSCSAWMYWRSNGVPWDPASQRCYLPNAAIAWKQPNGFYYPPAFHSNKLYFNSNVDIRHFVIEPLFLPGTFNTDYTQAQVRYCISADDMFDGFTDIDRQTELSDDDGTLTGLLGQQNPTTKLFSPSISVNKDTFFNVPVETAECASDTSDLMPQGQSCPYNSDGYPGLCATANSSPYEYVTSVVFPGCGVTSSCTDWDQSCTGNTCYGVPLYREDTNPGESGPTSIRMMGQDTYQRSTLAVNNARYYIDTTVSDAIQSQWATGPQKNVFQGTTGNNTYYVFQLFAKPTTKLTYQLYVGTDFDPSTLQVVRVNQQTTPPTFTPVAGAYPCPTKNNCFNKTTGILTVPLDMSKFSDFQTNYDAGRQDHCAPATFCTWNSKTSTCGCNFNQQATTQKECQNTCANWATKDVDCPEGGCYGFAFTLPADFVAGTPAVPPPRVTCFPKDSNWNVHFSAPTRNPGTQCTYTTIPTGTFCPPPANTDQLLDERSIFGGLELKW